MQYTIREAFARLKKIEEAIPPGECVWVMSLDNPANRQVGGRIVTVTRAIAARLIDEGSYRLATDEEQAAYEAGQERAREQARFVRLTPAISYRGECIALEPKVSGEPQAGKA